MTDSGDDTGGLVPAAGGRGSAPARRPPDLVRPATVDDVPAIRAILAAHDNDGPVTFADVVGPYVRHCIAHAIARVTERDGEVIAYGATIDTAVGRHLADLFVRPDLLGHGIGRVLLDAVFGGATRRTTFASADPRALPIYVRAGMAPLWPNLHLRGRGTALPPLDAGLTVEPAEPAGLAALEREWTGADRRVDHAFWGSLAAADGFVVLDRARPVAIGYGRARQVGPERAVDRLVVRPGGEPVGPAIAGLRRAARGGDVAACIPGPHPVLPVLLRAGFRVVDRDQFMASDPDLVDPARLLPNGGML